MRVLLLCSEPMKCQSSRSARSSVDLVNPFLNIALAKSPLAGGGQLSVP
jgi:hypothetical protein